jgi:uncharacterized membrane protein
MEIHYYFRRHLGKLGGIQLAGDNKAILFRSISIYPSEPLLSFVAAFQAPFIMMSQNRAEKKQDVAYRSIFTELKELVEQDIEHEQEIKHLEKEIRIDLEKLIYTQNKLLESLHQAIKLGQLTSEGVAEVLEHLEDEETNSS